MKVFLEFESIFPPQPIEMNGITYNEDEQNKLHGYSFPVHKYFNNAEDVVTEAKLYWGEDTKRLYMKMWLSSDDVNFFESHIINGSLVPSNVRLTPDNIEEESVKKLFDE